MENNFLKSHSDVQIECEELDLMVGYVLNLVGIFLLTGISAILLRLIRSKGLELNSTLGFRTSATMHSESAWNKGHKATIPYLQTNVILGIAILVLSSLALVVSELLGKSLLPGIIVLPGCGFFIQVTILIMATIKANSSAKEVISSS